MKSAKSYEIRAVRPEDFVAHYNNVRLHSAIGYITPADRAAGRGPDIWKARDEKLHAAREQRRARRQAASTSPIADVA